MAFATSLLGWEQLQELKRESSPLEVLPLDAFCAEFMGHNWGVPSELLCYSSGPFPRSEAMSLGLLHDVPVRPGSMEDVEVAGRLWRAFEAFGRHESQWLPYSDRLFQHFYGEDFDDCCRPALEAHQQRQTSTVGVETPQAA